MRVIALWLALASCLSAGTGADVARAIRENSFDRDECYRVRDLTLQKEDVRIYLTEGHLIFSKPVAGRRVAAVFSADVDGGDGEVMLLPPDRAERRSLSMYTDSPNLDEHIKAAVFLFTGDVYEQLKAQMAQNPSNRKSPEMGPVLDEKWSPVLRNLSTSYQSRLTLDLIDYRIESTIHPDLSMDSVARVKVRVSADGTAIAPFDIAREMEVREVKVDGVPAELLQAESMRVNLIRAGNNLFLVMPKEPLRAGRDYEFEFHYSGKVIHDAGDHVFFITARANWYPAFGIRFAQYDLTFRYPREFDLVSAGDVVEERTDGDWKITRRRTPAPIRVAAFNMGDYEHARLERGPYVVDVCANRKLERSLQPRVQAVPLPPAPNGLPRRRSDPLTAPLTMEAMPSPTEHLHALAEEVASALEFMAAKFGPPALPHLTVSPIPGTFGQGFPGLIYLSTLSYFKQLPQRVSTSGAASSEMFLQDVLQAHETAHQWWGNRVAGATYRDNWLMESLANYAALMYLEKRRGQRALEVMLENYRDALLAKNETGQLVDAAGPIVLGTRLESSIEPRAWRSITYGKGSWIMQMLRGRMGDERFLAMLGEVTRRFDRKEISTEQFRLVAAEFLPPKSDDPKLESFFGQWVYGTGIPTVKMSYSVKGAAPNVKVTGTVTASDVDEDFTA